MRKGFSGASLSDLPGLVKCFHVFLAVAVLVGRGAGSPSADDEPDAQSGAFCRCSLLKPLLKPPGPSVCSEHPRKAAPAHPSPLTFGEYSGAEMWPFIFPDANK